MTHGLLVDQPSKGILNKINNIHNFKKLNNKKFKDIELYTGDFYKNLFKLVDEDKVPDGNYFIANMRETFGNMYNTMVMNSKVKRLMRNYVYEDDLFYGKEETPSHVYIADAPKWKESTNKKKIEKKHIFGGTKSKLSGKLSEIEVRNVLGELLGDFDKNMIKYLIDDKEYKKYLGVSIEKIIPDYKTVHKKY